MLAVNPYMPLATVRNEYPATAAGKLDELCEPAGKPADVSRATKMLAAAFVPGKVPSTSGGRPLVYTMAVVSRPVSVVAVVRATSTGSPSRAAAAPGFATMLTAAPAAAAPASFSMPRRDDTGGASVACLASTAGADPTAAADPLEPLAALVRPMSAVSSATFASSCSIRCVLFIYQPPSIS